MSTKKKRETSKIFYVSKLKITHADYAHMLWSFGNHGKCVEVCASSVYLKKCYYVIQLANGAHRHHSIRVCPFARPRRPSPLRLLQQRHVETQAQCLKITPKILQHCQRYIRGKPS